jgi:hypothetical protein
LEPFVNQYPLNCSWLIVYLINGTILNLINGIILNEIILINGIIIQESCVALTQSGAGSAQVGVGRTCGTCIAVVQKLAVVPAQPPLRSEGVGTRVGGEEERARGRTAEVGVGRTWGACIAIVQKLSVVPAQQPLGLEGEGARERGREGKRERRKEGKRKRGREG